MRYFPKALLYFLSIGVAAYALFVYGFLPLGSLVHPDMREAFTAHPAGIYVHVFAASVALLLGPFQFVARIRRNYPRIHRWSGRFYLGIGVLAGGIAGLYMSRYAFGGPVARTGFATLATLWLFTGLRAYAAVRRGAFDEHRRWMVRNFSLAFAAVTLRLYLPISAVLGVDMELAYPVIAWLCWVPNIIFAEWRYNIENRPRQLSRGTI